MYITISGVDNSGKTTIAKALSDYFQLQGKKVVYKPEFDFFFTKVLLFFTKSSNVSALKNSVIIKGEKTFFSQVLYFLYFILVYLHFLCERLLYCTFWRKKILIRERYIYDFWVSVANNTWYKFYLFLAKIFPSSWYNFFLNVPLETILQRSYLRSFRFSNEHYQKLLKSYLYFQNEYINLHAENTIDAIVHEILLVCKLKTIKNIAISGIDGAWKSTTIENLQKKFSQYHISIYSLHFYYNFLVFKVMRLFKKKKQDTWDIYERSKQHEKKSKNTQKSLIWKFLVLFDAYVQYLFSLLFWLNKLKIYDRFFLDFEVSWSFLWLRYNKKIFNFFPKLNNYFILVADPEILYQRKPEHTLDFFIQCHKLYTDLSKIHNVILIDTSHCNEKEVINLICKHLQ